MKRLNKNTNLLYRSGDKPTAEDLPKQKGRFFLKYDLRPERIDTEGFFYENWVSPSRLKADKHRSKKVLGAARDLFYRGEGTYELNPKTKEKWKKQTIFFIYCMHLKTRFVIGLALKKFACGAVQEDNRPIR